MTPATRSETRSEPAASELELDRVRFTEHELIASICKADFYQFVKNFWPHAEAPVWNWHIKYLCRQLQKSAERVFRGLPKEHDIVINIPPGTTKSTICTIMFPAWVWTKMPSARFIGASHSFDLAMDLSRKNRDVVKSDLYAKCFPGVKIRDDQDTKGYWANTHGGYRFAVGTNGSVIGWHAHFIIIDDPIDPEGAVTDAGLKTANRWITETLSTRKVDKRLTVTVLIMQRLHQDDPTSRFLEQERVFHVCLPSEVEDDVKPPSLKKYYVDGLLDCRRLSEDVLREERRKGDQYYSSQFRQSPVPPGGAMFKVDKIKYSRTPPDKWVVKVRAWDKAGTEGGKGAYTTGVLLGLDTEGRFWVLDVIRVRLDSFEREKLIEKTATADGRQVIVVLEQEPGSGGKESSQNTVRRLGMIPQKPRVVVVKVGKSDGDKEGRADPFSSQVNGGNVYLYNSHWNGEYISELRYFPFSKYKDQVDASSLGYNHLYKPRKRAGTW